MPFGGYLAWRLATFGQWLPTTAIAKSQGLPTVAGFAKVGGLMGYVGWPTVLVGALLVGAALTRSRSVNDEAWVGGVGVAVALLLIPLTLALVAFGVLVPDWMEQFRFATPVWTLGPFVVASGGHRGGGRSAVAGPGDRRWRRGGGGAFSVAGFVTDVRDVPRNADRADVSDRHEHRT